MNNMFVPKKIKVGYQNRNNTYNGKLAYVIYYDEKNVLRKEKSFLSWIDKKIKTNDFENEPTEGFVLNKKVGGGNYSWNNRNEWIRVYDPRGFEFEISISNLLFILEQHDCCRGKGLQGQFVYSWKGSDLILLPVNSLDYKNSIEFTELKNKSINKKDLEVGFIYKMKDTKSFIYLGNMNKNRVPYEFYERNSHYGDKTLIFLNTENNEYRFLKDSSKIAQKISEEPVEGYKDLIANYTNSKFFKKIVGLKIKEISDKERKKCLYSHLINQVSIDYKTKEIPVPTPNNLKFSSLFDNGIMHSLVKDIYCKAKKIGNEFYLFKWIEEKTYYGEFKWQLIVQKAVFSPHRSAVDYGMQIGYFENFREIPEKKPNEWNHFFDYSRETKAKNYDLILEEKKKFQEEMLSLDPKQKKCSSLFVQYEDGSEESMFSYFSNEKEASFLKELFKYNDKNGWNVKEEEEEEDQN